MVTIVARAEPRLPLEPSPHPLPEGAQALTYNSTGLLFVVPANAGIQSFQEVLDPGFRRGDEVLVAVSG